MEMFWPLLGIGLIIFLWYVGEGIRNYLSGNNSDDTDTDKEPDKNK